MKELVIYALETLACGGVLLAAYALLLERRIGFGWCRAYLLTATVLMALIPLLRIPVWPGKVIELTPMVTIDSDWTAAVIEPEPEPLVTPETVLAAFYLLGAGLIVALMIWQAVRIRNMRRNSQKVRCDGYTLIRTRQKIASFSFFRSIYIWRGTPDEELPAILAHERSHIAHHHSIERIFMECLKAALWWNPFVWIAARRLTQAEEFEADSDVLRSGYDLENYMNTLFKQLFGYSPDIANGLRDSLTKKRFQMMTTQTPGRRSLLRLAATLPALAGLLCAFSFTSRAAVVRMPDNAGDQPEEFFKRVILLNGKPATIDEVYRLDPACIDTAYTIQGKAIDGKRPEVDFTYYINTKGTPRQSKLTTLTGRVHYPDGKPATGINVYAANRNFVMAANQAELDRLGTTTDAQGHYKLQAPTVGWVSTHSFYQTTSGSYDSKGNKNFVHDIEIDYPDSARWQKRVEANGRVTLQPQRVPDTEYRDKYTVVAPKEVEINLIINLQNSDGSFTDMANAQGAIVKIIGTDKGVTADQNGKAKIMAPVGSVLEIMHIGYEPTTITVPQGDTAYAFTLMTEGRSKPKDITITARDKDGIKQRPLVIVDGIEFPSIDNVDVAQIDNMTVLKGEAATATYGERGKNGVLVITTKSTKATATPAPSATSGQIEDTTPFLVAETMPRFQGGDLMGFRTWVQQNIKYPAQAMASKIQGRVVLQFIIERNGTVNPDVKILQSPDKILSEEARRVIASSPAWTPGEQRGQKVRVVYTLPVDFRITGNDEKPTNVASPQSGDDTFLVAETMPKFQGGDLNTYRTWLQQQVRYPAEALAKNIAGRVVATFVIEKDGSISNINILQSPDKLLTDEARRIMAKTPAWTPGTQKGQPVRVKYTIPIDFRVMTDTGKNLGSTEKDKPQASASTAEELIVVGYGTEKK